MFTCLFSYATCVAVKISADLVFAWVRWHGQSHAPARRQLAAAVCAGGRCESWLRLTACHDVGLLSFAYRYARSAFCTVQKKSCTIAPRGMSRTGLRPRLGLATATPALAALRLPHEHARAEHARHTHCTRASLASDARALTLQPALARKKARLPCSSHWPLADRRPAGR